MDLTLLNRYKNEIEAIIKANTHIAAHAVMMDAFMRIIEAKEPPKLIVELGVGVKGIRTQAICRAASLFDAVLIGCDIKDCLECGNKWYSKWHFFQRDARLFADEFAGVCFRLGLLPEIDVLFIDTDELYDTTKEIWHKWKKFLIDSSMVMFRCSNLQKRLYYADGRETNLGWDNQRGVIRVIEEIIGGKFDEKEIFIGEINGWQIWHTPYGGGLTVISMTPTIQKEKSLV